MKKLLFLFVLNLFVFFSLKAQSNIAVGEKAPAIHITDWIANVPADKSLEGKYIVLEFWATWCGPCIKAVPHMNAIQDQFRDRKDLYFISMTDESVAKVERTLQKVPFQSIVVSDQTQATHIQYGDGDKGLEEYPLTVLIDNQGKVNWIGGPFALTASQIERMLEGKSPEVNIKITGIKIQQAEMPAGKADNQSSDPKKETIPKDGLSRFFSLFKDKSLLSFFELKKTDRASDNVFTIGDKGIYYEGKRLKKIYSGIHSFPEHQVFVPEDLENSYFRLTYKNLHPDTTSRNLLGQAILQALHLEQTLEKRSVIVLEMKVENPSSLEPTLENNRSASEAGKLLILKKHTLASLFEALNGMHGLYFTVEDGGDKEYDFIVDVSSPDVLKESLRSYGLHGEKKEKEVDIMLLRYKG